MPRLCQVSVHILLTISLFFLIHWIELERKVLMQSLLQLCEYFNAKIVSSLPAYSPTN